LLAKGPGVSFLQRRYSSAPAPFELLMPRESNIPLFLWIATAVLAHLLWGGGATGISRVLEERLDVKRFAAHVRWHVASNSGPIEVSLLDEQRRPDELAKKEEEKDQEDPPEPEKDEEKEKERERAKQSQDSEQDDPEAKPDRDLDEHTPKLALEPEQKKPEEEKKADEPLPELPVMPMRNRIAVQQHVDDKNQKDNPDAELIADDANKVDKQTQARITSTDRNDKDTNPGGAHTGPSPEPGNSDESRVAQSEDRPGMSDLAPNESGKEDKDKGGATEPVPPQAAQASNAPDSAMSRARPGIDQGSETSKHASRLPPQQGQKAQGARGAQEAAPDLMSSDQGSDTVAPAQQAQTGRKARRAKKKRLPPPKRSSGIDDILGFGSRGTTKNGVNLNLAPQTAIAAIGQDQLAREKRADAQRRKSAHLGSWKSLGIDRWRAAIENYVPSVQPGNQTALNTARVPFASYLNTVHNRLHPIFADSFLASLDGLPGGHPMNRPEIRAHLEIVLSQDDGRVVRMGITRTSGVTAFDIAALESVQRGSPYGPPPRDIVSPDGNVYFHWEFHRNPYYACSTYFARPYILKVKPKSAPPSIDPPAPRPYDPKEPPDKDQRHGLLIRVPELVKHAALR
jgi:hypothetical protein